MYLLYYSVPYEGHSVYEFSSLAEVKDWLQKHRSSYDYDLDNVDVVKVESSVNVYDLMKD